MLLSVGDSSKHKNKDYNQVSFHIKKNYEVTIMPKQPTLYHCKSIVFL